MLVSNLMKTISSYNQSRHISQYNHKQDCKRIPKNSPSFKAPEPVIDSVITMNSGPSGFTGKEISEVNPTVEVEKSYQTSQGINKAEDNLIIFILAYSHHAEYDMCCGEFPNIRPFSSRQGKRKCCGEKVFDWKRRECCPDNRVAAFGDC